VHERYDLKGSWINRRLVTPEHGQATACRHCGQRFRVGAPRAKNACPARPNHSHEANTVLRDTDWVYKLRLGRLHARALRAAIAADTEFLRSQGIMDYSLLLGIHRSKYRLVNGDEDDAAAASAAGGAGGTGGAGGAGGASPASSVLSGLSAPPPPLPPPPAGRAPPRHARAAPLSPDAAPLRAPGAATPASARPWGFAWSAADAVSPLPEGALGEPALGVSGGGGGARGARAGAAEASFSGGAFDAPSDIAPDDEDAAAAARGGPRAVYHEESEGGGGGAPPPHAASIFSAHRGGLRAAVVEGPGVYYMGIIDVLQRWTLAKRVENFLKTRVLLKDLGGVSAIEPDAYAARFRTRVISQLIEE